MNTELYKALLRLNLAKILSHASGIAAYEGLLAWVYPLVAKSPAVTEVAGNLPTAVKSVFGVSEEANLNTFEAYMSGQFYGRIWALIMCIYGIGTANRLTAGFIDDGALGYPLAAPLSRTEIFGTQTAVALSGVGMITGATVIGILGSAYVFQIEINRWRYIRLGVLGLSFFTLITAYSLLFSVSADHAEEGMLYSTGITLGFYLMDVLAGLNKDWAWLRKFTLFGWFKPQEILEGKSPTKPILAMAGLSALLLALASLVFTERDLAL